MCLYLKVSFTNIFIHFFFFLHSCLYLSSFTRSMKRGIVTFNSLKLCPIIYLLNVPAIKMSLLLSSKTYLSPTYSLMESSTLIISLHFNNFPLHCLVLSVVSICIIVSFLKLASLSRLAPLYSPVHHQVHIGWAAVLVLGSRCAFLLILFSFLGLPPSSRFPLSLLVFISFTYLQQSITF